MKYPDFLRHIVNPKLAKYTRERRNLGNHVDEIRKFIAEAENKYQFSIFNGDPEKLADYLLSEDFTLLVKLFKSAGSLDVLEEILLETREKYSDLPRISKTIDKVLKKIREQEKAKES